MGGADRHEEGDVSLDEFIAKNDIRSNVHRGRANGNRYNDGGKIHKRSTYTPYKRTRNLPDRWEHDMYEAADHRPRDHHRASRHVDRQSKSKLIINNLDFAVTDDDIEELFVEFGPLRKVSILYNRSGRSSGAAELIFVRAEDAREAKEQYNGVPLDGRTMEITLVDDNVGKLRSSSRSKSSRRS